MQGAHLEFGGDWHPWRSNHLGGGQLSPSGRERRGHMLHPCLNLLPEYMKVFLEQISNRYLNVLVYYKLRLRMRTNARATRAIAATAATTAIPAIRPVFEPVEDEAVDVELGEADAVLSVAAGRPDELTVEEA